MPFISLHKVVSVTKQYEKLNVHEKDEFCRITGLVVNLYEVQGDKK